MFRFIKKIVQGKDSDVKHARSEVADMLKHNQQPQGASNLAFLGLFYSIISKTKVPWGVLIALSILCGGLYVRFLDPWWVETVRLKTFDSYNRAMPRIPSEPSPVFIIDLDEKSLAKVGQWPWSRVKVAELIDALNYYQVPVVGFDIVFSEPDRTSPSLLAQNLPPGNEALAQQLEALPTNDSIMAKAMQQVPTVMGQAGTNLLEVEDGVNVNVGIGEDRLALNETAKFSSVQGFLGTKGVNDADPTRFISHQGILVYNIQELESSAAGLGLFSIENEIDGVVRRVPLIMSVQNILKPTLSLEMLRVAMQGNSIFSVVNKGGLQEVGLQTQQVNPKVPVDGNGRIWVYYAMPDAFNTPNNTGRLYVSASDIMERKVPIEQIRGRMALVGTSSVGLVDIRATPVNPRQPGVEVHANVIENLIDGDYLSYPLEMISFEMIAAIIASLLLIFLVPRVSPLWTLSGFLFTVGGLFGISIYLYTDHRLLLDFTYSSSLVFVVYATMAFSNYNRDAQEKKQVRTAFAQYLSPDLVEQLAQDPTQLRLGGETKRMTLLFCDVRGFTAISEQFKSDPQGLTRLINSLLTPLTFEILQRRGTIDKYMGDCIMAFWNAPIAVQDQEYNSCLAANAMFKALQTLNDKRLAAHDDSQGEFLPLKVGIGINTGDCVVGNMGSEQRFDYSVLGDAVNLAARLEGQSKSYGVGTVIGTETAAMVKDRLPVLELDLIAVKGKKEAVRVFTLAGDESLKGTEEFTELFNLHEKILTAYRAQEWNNSENLIHRAIGKCNGVMDEFYHIYLERIEAFRHSPPPAEWDGVFVATSK